jgi:SAM-dependent methyltransferase
MVQDLTDRYEAYPYPPYHPERDDEPCYTWTNNFYQIGHYLHGGRFPFNNESRILFAGGGIGDSTIDMATQCIAFGITPELVHLDLSARSNEICKERLERKGLDHLVTIHQGSLLDLPNGAHGMFDYINCSGVLHHLEDPDEGLRALGSVLNEDGGMGIMLYAPYGRRFIYDIQDILKLMWTEDDTLEDMIPCARQIKTAIPKSNPVQSLMLAAIDKSEIVDRYLHLRDRAYSVGEIYDYVENADLMMGALVPESAYFPERMTKNATLENRFNKLSPRARFEIGEIICGNLNMHCFYVGKNIKPRPDRDDISMVPVLMPRQYSLRQQHWPQGATMGSAPQETLSAEEILFVHLIDDKRTIGDIFALFQDKYDTDHNKVKSLWRNVCQVLGDRSDIVLHDPSTVP